MLNNTIPNQAWQLESHINGHCVISARALGQLLLSFLSSAPEISGIGPHATALDHPDAWQALQITRIDAYTVPVTMHADAIRTDVVQRIQMHVTQQMSRWLGVPVSITIVVVYATPSQHKG